MDDKQDAIGRIIDDLDSVTHSLLMPLPAQLHVDSLRQLLPAKVRALKNAFVDLTGQDPWRSVK